MVDFDGFGCVGTADEVDGHAAVRVDEGATLGVAGAAANDEVLQIAAQDVIAGVAAVVAELDVDVIAPGLTELIALEVRGAVPAAYLKLFESLARDVESGGITRRGRRQRYRGRRRLGAPGRRRTGGLPGGTLLPEQQARDGGDHQNRQNHGEDPAPGFRGVACCHCPVLARAAHAARSPRILLTVTPMEKICRRRDRHRPRRRPADAPGSTAPTGVTRHGRGGGRCSDRVVRGQTVSGGAQIVVPGTRDRSTRHGDRASDRAHHLGRTARSANGQLGGRRGSAGRGSGGS